VKVSKLTRQLLLNEIERIYLENNEKKENMVDEIYVFNRYPLLSSLFGQYKIGNEKWHQLVREVIFYAKGDLRYMYDRTMQLLRRFHKDVTAYFDVKTEVGTYTLPDRLSDLNRLFELYIEFFTVIYPNVNRRLRFDVYSQELDSEILRGRVLWSKTIRRCINQGGQTYPLTFTTLVQKYGFETPENILTILSVLKLKQDALFLMMYDFKDPLTREELAMLSKIADGCDIILKTTLLKELIPLASKYVTVDLADSRILNLEAQSYTRLRGEQRETNPYLQLLQWIQRYRELNLRSVSINKTNFPIDRRQNLDTMFEVWVLFEFLDYLTTYEGAVVTIESFPRRFTISIHGVVLTLFYEKEYSGWAINARPDFSLEKDGKLKVVMDAKNWLQPKFEAVYKMLGYLNNLDGTIGILFFPNESSLSDQRICEGLNLNHHRNQLLFNCVVRPSGSQEAIRQKHNVLKQTAQIIFRDLGI
jgi:hypothetical protein